MPSRCPRGRRGRPTRRARAPRRATATSRASRSATPPPIELPHTTARSMPAWSSTRSTASACARMVARDSGTSAERPWPGRSTSASPRRRATSALTSSQVSLSPPNPWMPTSGRPRACLRERYAIAPSGVRVARTPATAPTDSSSARSCTPPIATSTSSRQLTVGSASAAATAAGAADSARTNARSCSRLGRRQLEVLRGVVERQLVAGDRPARGRASTAPARSCAAPSWKNADAVRGAAQGRRRERAAACSGRPCRGPVGRERRAERGG